MTKTQPALDQGQAAAYLGIKPMTLEKWRWSGRGPIFIKVGRLVRYRQADLDKFLEEHSVRPRG